MRKPVRREFGQVLGHGQVISNDQVNDDFALALELGGFGLEALALVQCGPDLVTAIRAWSGICAERSSCPTSVTNCAHIASNRAWVAAALHI